MRDSYSCLYYLFVLNFSPHEPLNLFYALLQKQNTTDAVGSTKASEDELTCSVCLEQVSVGELIRSLPCLHQVQPFLSMIQNQYLILQVFFWVFSFHFLEGSSVNPMEIFFPCQFDRVGINLIENDALFCSSTLIALIHGCGNREHALFVNTEQGPGGMKMVHMVKWMLLLWFNLSLHDNSL